MTQTKMSRRKFLQVSAITGGALIAACGGLTAAGLYEPPVDCPTVKGENKMDGKILVAYASFCGSTAGVAQEIANTITAKGESVDLMLAKDVKDLSPYKSVVLGSAIRMGKWKGEAGDFVKKFQGELNQKPTAFFSVCLTIKDDTPENRETAQAYTEPQRVLVKPVHEAFFAGQVDYQKFSFFTGFLMKNMIKAPEGDFRQWDKIKTWAGQLA